MRASTSSLLTTLSITCCLLFFFVPASTISPQLGIEIGEEATETMDGPLTAMLTTVLGSMALARLRRATAAHPVFPTTNANNSASTDSASIHQHQRDSRLPDPTPSGSEAEMDSDFDDEDETDSEPRPSTSGISFRPASPVGPVADQPTTSRQWIRPYEPDTDAAMSAQPLAVQVVPPLQIVQARPMPPAWLHRNYDAGRLPQPSIAAAIRAARTESSEDNSDGSESSNEGHYPAWLGIPQPERSRRLRDPRHVPGPPRITTNQNDFPRRELPDICDCTCRLDGGPCRCRKSTALCLCFPVPSDPGV